MANNDLIDEPEVDDEAFQENERQAKSKVRVILFVAPIILIMALLFGFSRCSFNGILG